MGSIACLTKKSLKFLLFVLHCQPPVPSRETASPVDLEGTKRTKGGGVASTRVREELGSADSVFKGTETFEGTRAENFYCGDTVAWLPRWVTSKMRSRRKPSEARGRSSTERGATRPSRVREEQSAGLWGHFQFSAPVRAKPGFPLPAPALPTCLAVPHNKLPRLQVRTQASLCL